MNDILVSRELTKKVAFTLKLLSCLKCVHECVQIQRV